MVNKENHHYLVQNHLDIDYLHVFLSIDLFEKKKAIHHDELE